MMNRWRVGVALVGLLAIRATAQNPVRQSADTTKAPSAAECDSMVARARVDSVSTTVRAYLQRIDGGIMSRNYADLLLQDFAQRFHPPQPLRIPVLAAGPASLRALSPEKRTGAAVRELYIDDVVDFTAKSDGTIGALQLRITSMSPEFDSTVVATLVAMGREDLMPVPTSEEKEDTIPLRLRITSGPGWSGHERALFISQLPKLSGSDAMELEGNPLPPYPEEEKALGMDGYVLFQIIVSRQGSVQPGTIEVLQSTSLAFLRSALGVLDSMRFTPAHVGSCPMPQVMRLPFRFQAPGRGTAR